MVVELTFSQVSAIRECLELSVLDLMSLKSRFNSPLHQKQLTDEINERRSLIMNLSDEMSVELEKMRHELKIEIANHNQLSVWDK